MSGRLLSSISQEVFGDSRRIEGIKDDIPVAWSPRENQVSALLVTPNIDFICTESELDGDTNSLASIGTFKCLGKNSVSAINQSRKFSIAISFPRKFFRMASFKGARFGCALNSDIRPRASLWSENWNDQQAFSAVLIDNIQHPHRPSVVRLGTHKVVRPYMVRVIWPQPHARPIVEPQSTSCFLFPEEPSALRDARCALPDLCQPASRPASAAP